MVRRRISQWVVSITAYADRLIEGLDRTEFIEKVKAAQINWIGKSEGARIQFRLAGRDETLDVFTTRPDTLWGATFHGAFAGAPAGFERSQRTRKWRATWIRRRGNPTWSGAN